MKRNNPIIEMFTDPNKSFLVYFFGGTILFGIVSDGFSDLFWDQLIPWLQKKPQLSPILLPWTIVGFLVLGVMAIAYLIPVSRRFKQILTFALPGYEPEVATNVKELDEYFPGLIAVMSPKRPEEESPAERVILHHLNNDHPRRLKHCWLICTSKSQSAAQELEKKLIDMGLSQTFELHYGEKYIIDDPEHSHEKLSLLVRDHLVNDPIYIQRLVNCIYTDAQNNYNLEDSDIIADFTGGTKSMTVGVVLAGATRSRRLQYISQLSEEHPLMEIKIAYKLTPLKTQN